MSERPRPVRTPIERLAREWLAYQREHRERDFWAWEEVEARIGLGGDLEDGWLLVLELLELARPDNLTYTAAGPLESLIRTHREAVVDRIVKRATEDEKFRECLAGVWLDEDELRPEEMARLVWASGGRIRRLR